MMPKGFHSRPDLDTAVLVIDVQYDFCPGGALAVSGGDRIIPVLNRLLRDSERYPLRIYASRDWHPAESTHFDSGGGIWPVHCVAGSEGAKFHNKLRLPGDTQIVSKGLGTNGDSYSVFDGQLDDGVPFENALRRDGITHVVVGGLATDYCVRCSVLDALRLGIRVTLLTDAIAAVEAKLGDGEKALNEMRRAGAELTHSAAIGWAAPNPGPEFSSKTSPDS